MFPFIFAYQPYIKKEDVKGFAKKRRTALSLIFFAGIFSSLLFALFLLPVLSDSSYLDHPSFSMLPSSSYYFILSAIIGACLGIFYMTTNPDYKTLDEKLKQYKEGEMILGSKLSDQRSMTISFTYMLFQIIPLLFFIFFLMK